MHSYISLSGMHQLENLSFVRYNFDINLKMNHYHHEHRMTQYNHSRTRVNRYR